MMVLRVEEAFTIRITSRESGGGFKSRLFRDSAQDKSDFSVCGIKTRIVDEADPLI
jgi:hypothetical protein